MNEFYIQTLLDEVTVLKKRITRLGVLFYICPVVYFLIDNSIDINVSLGFVSIANNEIILSFMPTLCLGIYYYLFYSATKMNSLLMLIEALAPKDKKSQAWLSGIWPDFALNNLFSDLAKSSFSTIFLLIPFLLLIVCIPFVFQIYITYELLLQTILEGTFILWFLSAVTITLIFVIFYPILTGKDLSDLFQERAKLIKNLENEADK